MVTIFNQYQVIELLTSDDFKLLKQLDRENYLQQLRFSGMNDETYLTLVKDLVVTEHSALADKLNLLFLRDCGSDFIDKAHLDLLLETIKLEEVNIVKSYFQFLENYPFARVVQKHYKAVVQDFILCNKKETIEYIWDVLVKYCHLNLLNGILQAYIASCIKQGTYRILLASTQHIEKISPKFKLRIQSLYRSPKLWSRFLCCNVDTIHAVKTLLENCLPFDMQQKVQEKYINMICKFLPYISTESITRNFNQSNASKWTSILKMKSMDWQYMQITFRQKNLALLKLMKRFQSLDKFAQLFVSKNAIISSLLLMYEMKEVEIVKYMQTFYTQGIYTELGSVVFSQQDISIEMCI